MDSEAAIIILRLLHVVIGALWVGALVMMTFFLNPTARATGATGGQFIGVLIQRTRLPVWLAAAGVVTLFSGVALYWIFYSVAPWTSFGPHIVYGIGGILALVAFALGLLVSRPAAARFAGLARMIATQGTPPTPQQAAERDSLATRLARVAVVNASLLIGTIGLMAIGRYV